MTKRESAFAYSILH